MDSIWLNKIKRKENNKKTTFHVPFIQIIRTEILREISREGEKNVFREPARHGEFNIVEQRAGHQWFESAWEQKFEWRCEGTRSGRSSEISKKNYS